VKVQRQARSLLALLGVVGESSPPVAYDIITPTLDVGYLLNQTRGGFLATFLGAQAVGGVVTTAVPLGEFWQIIAVQGHFVGQVGMTGGAIALELSLDGNGFAGIKFEEFSAAVLLGVGAHIFRTHWMPSSPMILGQGSAFRTRLDALTGVGATGIGCDVLFYRLPA